MLVCLDILHHFLLVIDEFVSVAGHTQNLIGVVLAIENLFDFQSKFGDFLRDREGLCTPDLDGFD